MKHLSMVVFLISILFYAGCTSSPLAKRNAENIKKIQSGMRMESVKEMMGEPERIVIAPNNDKEFEFQYLSPSGYSDHFRIFISRSDSIVLRIGDGL